MPAVRWTLLGVMVGAIGLPLLIFGPKGVWVFMRFFVALCLDKLMGRGKGLGA